VVIVNDAGFKSSLKVSAVARRTGVSVRTLFVTLWLEWEAGL
jgi:hypothetical protein